MAMKIDVPGFDQDVDPTSASDIVTTFVMVMLGILFTIAAGGAASRAYNWLAGQSDAISEVDLV